MEANARTIRKILHSGDQYVIPFFQRYYSWKRKHWQTLRDDLWALAENGKSDQHFLGPMVCTAIDHVPGEIPAYQLIDGQQRLTTLTVMLSALRDVAREKQLDKFANKVHEDCLIHRNEEDLQRYKVVPRIGDRKPLIAVIDGKLKQEHSVFNVVKAYKFFCQEIRRFAGSGDPQQRLQQLFSIIADQLTLVVITISAENAYEIFESLNSTGLELAESDLIRNYMFMQIGLDQQEKFHDDHWRPFEERFDQTKGHAAIEPTAFYRNYLMREGTFSRSKATFDDFKKQHSQGSLSPFERVEELDHYARLYLYLRRPETCPDREIGEALANFELLDAATAHPLLLNLLDRESRGQITTDTLQACIADVASFVLRRSVCAETARSYNRWFVEAIKKLGDNPLDNLRSYLASRRWPDDEQFREAIVEFDFYHRESVKCRLVLLELERDANAKEPIGSGELTIEHIMPVSVGSDKKGKAWKKMLGDNWKQVHEEWLHRLGNLTLTGYNTPLGNKPFEEKRIEYEKSNLSLNRSIASREHWNEVEIGQRGETLAQRVAELWPRTFTGEVELLPDDGEDRGQGAKTYKQKRINYWSDLAQVVHDLGQIPATVEVSDKTTIHFPTEVENVELWAWIVSQRAEVSIGMTFKRKPGRSLHKALSTEKEAIEADFGEVLDWGDNDKWITLTRPNSRIVEEEDWFDQHQWMADKLASFYRVIVPRVQQLYEAGVGRGSGKSQRNRADRAEYWNQFCQFAAEHAPELKLGKPSGDATMIVRVGWRKLRFRIGGYDNRDKIFVRLTGPNKVKQPVLQALLPEKEAIESEFGDNLIGRGVKKRSTQPDDPLGLQANTDGSLTEREDWDHQFAWYVRTVKQLRDILGPRIEGAMAKSTQPA